MLKLFLLHNKDQIFSLSDHADFEPVVDKVWCSAFYGAIEQVAQKYEITYLDARREIIRLYKSQNCFSVWAICNFAINGRGWVGEAMANLSKE